MEKHPGAETHKERFQSDSSWITLHRSWTESPEVALFLDYAMLEYQRKLAAEDTDTEGAAANHFKLVGANQFVKELLNLSVKMSAPSRADSHNLNHRA